MEFDVSRNNAGNANVGHFRIFGLNPTSRNNLRYDFYDWGLLSTMTLQAGYGRNLPTIFAGNIITSQSYREGVTFMTEIDAHDIGFAFINADFNQPYEAGTPYQQIMDDMINSLGVFGVKPGITNPDFATYQGNTKLPVKKTYSGKTIQLLTELTGNNFFIDNGKSYVLNINDVISGTLKVLDESAGIINSPRLEYNTVHLEMEFEPSILMSQLLTLNLTQNSSLNSDQNLNGDYKVISIKHRGIISPTVCGDAITTLGLISSKYVGSLNSVQGEF